MDILPYFKLNNENVWGLKKGLVSQFTVIYLWNIYIM